MLDDRLLNMAPAGLAIGIGAFRENAFDLTCTYSPQWQDLYFRLGGLAADPVVANGLTRNGLFKWSMQHPALVTGPKDFFTAAHDFAMTSGIAYASEIAGSRLIAGIPAATLSSAGTSLLPHLLRTHHLDVLTRKTEALREEQKLLIQLFAQGLRAKEVAYMLQVSEDTIKQRKLRIQAQIGVNNFNAVLALAGRCGFAFHLLN